MERSTARMVKVTNLSQIKLGTVTGIYGVTKDGQFTELLLKDDLGNALRVRGQTQYDNLEIDVPDEGTVIDFEVLEEPTYRGEDA